MDSATAIGRQFIRWGLGLLVFGLFLGFGIIGHYIVGARWPTGHEFMGNISLWFACPWTLSVYTIQAGAVGMIVIGGLYLTLGRAPSTVVHAGERAAPILCALDLIAMFLTGYVGYFVVDMFWPSFYYTPIAEGKNVWLGLQAACIALYWIGVILVTRGVYRTTRAIALSGVTLACAFAGMAGCATGRSTEPSAQVETAKTPIGDIALQFGLPATPDEERRIYDQMDFQRGHAGVHLGDPVRRHGRVEERSCESDRRGRERNRAVPRVQGQDRHPHREPHDAVPHHLRQPVEGADRSRDARRQYRRDGDGFLAARHDGSGSGRPGQGQGR